MSVADARPTYVRWTRSSRAFATGALLAIGGLTLLLWNTPTALGSLLFWLLGALIGLDAMRGGYFAEGTGSFWIDNGILHVKRGVDVWKLRGDSLVGASSSRGQQGWDMTLQARGKLPITLQGLDEDSVQQICEVLGIGSAGFGQIVFRARSGRTAAAVLLGVMGTYMLFMSFAMAAGVFGALMLPFAVLLYLFGMGRREPVVSLSDEGLGILWLSRRVVIPWQALTGIRRDPKSLTLHVAGQPVPIILPIRKFFIAEALSPAEADLVERQVEAALERARGLGRPRRIDATGTSELLGRGTLPMVEWHAHLDRLAAEMAHGGGYRSLRIDRDALHEVLSNPDADPMSRVGAARILARVEGERVRERIEVARASMHSEEDIVAFEDAIAETEIAARRPLR